MGDGVKLSVYKKWWFWLIIILVIFILGYLAYSRGYFDSELGICKAIQERSISEACVEALAEKRTDVSLCDKAFFWLGESRQREDCINTYAEYKGDKNACELLIFKNIWLKTFYDARDLCLSRVIKNNPDPTICSSIITPYAKNTCYIGLATQTGTVDYCNNIVETNYFIIINWTRAKESCILESERRNRINGK